MCLFSCSGTVSAGEADDSVDHRLNGSSYLKKWKGYAVSQFHQVRAPAIANQNRGSINAGYRRSQDGL